MATADDGEKESKTEHGATTADAEKGKTTALTVGAATVEQAAVTAAGAVGTIVFGPVGGIIGAAGAKAAATLVRAAVASHVRARAEVFEKELERALGDDGTARLPEALKDGAFSDVVFQNYRRAMDALSPTVIEALARLTATYRGKEPDWLFRSLGRLLEDLSSSEFLALRTLVSAVVKVGGGVVNITPWESVPGKRELRLQPANVRGNVSVAGIVAPEGVLRVLRLIERFGLDHYERTSGADLAMTGRTPLNVKTCEEVERIIGAVDVDVFPAAFDRPDRPAPAPPAPAQRKPTR